MRRRNEWPLAACWAAIIASACFLGVSFGPATPSLGEEASESALLAPLVDDQTVAIASLDVSRPDLEQAVEQLLAALDVRFSFRTDEAPKHLKTIQALRSFGAQKLYLVASLRDAQWGTFWVVKLRPGADVAKIAEVMPSGLTSMRRGELLVLAYERKLDQLKRLTPTPRPHLADAMAGTSNPMFRIIVMPTPEAARVIMEITPTLPETLGGGSTEALSSGVRLVVVDGDVAARPYLMLTIESADPEKAAQLQSAIVAVLKAASASEVLNRYVPQLAPLTRFLMPDVKGKRLTVRLDEENGGLSALKTAIAVPVQEATQAAQKSHVSNALKQLALATYVYMDSHRVFPPAFKADGNGKPLLSWRVLVLPYLEGQELYKQFHLDEPWDSPHNKQLISKMPDIYRHPASKFAGQYKTAYLAVRGKDTMFPGAAAVRLRDVRDGTSQTLMLVEVDDEHAVVWTRPDDWPFDTKQPRRGLGQFPGGFWAAFADGSVKFFKDPLDPAALGALFTRAAGDLPSELTR